MARRHMEPIRDAMIAVAVACALVGTWELVDWLVLIGTSDPDAAAATGLVGR
jgi:hypothetical protein